MGLTPFRMVMALGCGAMATSVLYLAQQAMSSPLSPRPFSSAHLRHPLASHATLPVHPPASQVVVAGHSNATASRVVSTNGHAADSTPVKHTTVVMPGGPMPRRIVVRHAQPGDVVLTMRGDALEVEFHQAPPHPPRPVGPGATPPKEIAP